MAFEQGTATDFDDLLDRLRLFLTTNPTLLAESPSQAWVTERWTPNSELILRGPGLAGTDQIYIGIRSLVNVGADIYNWDIRGSIGYVSGNDFTTQPGISPPSYCLFGNFAMPYTFMASGRSVRGRVRVGSVDTVFYLGFIFPNGTPNQVPYPLFVGGSSGSNVRHSDTSNTHRAFFDPSPGSTWFRDTAGTWLEISNWFLETQASTDDRYLAPYIYPFISSYRDSPGGERMLARIEVVTHTPKNNWGSLEGCYYVSGFGATSGDITQENSIDYLLAQNTFRTGFNNFVALERN